MTRSFKIAGDYEIDITANLDSMYDIKDYEKDIKKAIQFALELLPGYGNKVTGEIKLEEIEDEH